MTSPISLFESVNTENFDLMRYRIANPDVVRAGVDPVEHFQKCGIFENRMQLNSELLAGSDYRRKKFEKFSSVIVFNNSENDASFPITLSDRIYDISEYLAESANDEFGDFLSEITAKPDGLFLNLGSGLRKFHFKNCLYLEVYPSVSADIIVEPVTPYPLKDNAFDGIGCFAVLEHTRQPWKVVQEIYRMLKPGGRVFIDWPFLQPVHGFPSHFFNATREGLRSIFEDAGFSIGHIKTYPHQGPQYTINWVVGKFLNDLPEGTSNKIKKMTVEEFTNIDPNGAFWLDILNNLPDSVISEFSCGNSLVATKI